MKAGVDYYQWKVQGEFGELFTPHGDPTQYEYPFDYLFYSIEDAHAGLVDFGIPEQYYEGEEDNAPDGWHPEDWVLVKTRIELL
jgi:hypothetical protein